MNTIRQLLTVPEAAARLGLRESTIRSWVLARRIGRVRIGRRSIRIPVEEVERLIQEGSEPARRKPLYSGG
jgi:excisionase family DNA binding protein